MSWTVIKGHITNIISSAGFFRIALSKDAKGFRGVGLELPSHAQRWSLQVRAGARWQGSAGKRSRPLPPLWSASDKQGEAQSRETWTWRFSRVPHSGKKIMKARLEAEAACKCGWTCFNYSEKQIFLSSTVVYVFTLFNTNEFSNTLWEPRKFPVLQLPLGVSMPQRLSRTSKRTLAGVL